MEKPWIICFPACLIAPFLVMNVSSASSSWEQENGVAITRPSATNSNIVQLEVGCGDPYHFGVYAQHGAVLARDGSGEADYFYEPGRIQAVIDGSFTYPLVAAGSGDAVILLAEGTKEDNYLADIEESFIMALKQGSELLLRFDISPDNAADGSQFETYALFLLSGMEPIIDDVLKDCGSS